MGWLTRKLAHWTAGRQRGELEAFVVRLRSMDDRRVGLVVARATDFRHHLESQGHIVSDPIIYLAYNPRFPMALSRMILGLQGDARMQDATALMVWVHTLRAARSLELRDLGRQMWRELSRGFPYVETAAEHFGELTGGRLDIASATEFPRGLAPLA
ncbi:MAG TPA: hypothetical protein VKA14_08420 [Gammaproteobacteria bacterium]|nr:hypothetical protein [Gammaproteobacteria bacterium]